MDRKVRLRNEIIEVLARLVRAHAPDSRAKRDILNKVLCMQPSKDRQLHLCDTKRIWLECTEGVELTPTLPDIKVPIRLQDLSDLKQSIRLLLDELP